LRRDVGANVRSHKVDGSDIGKFMTPGLRDLKLTGPYMHNGTFDTLKAVVAFYNNVGGKDANKDARIKPTWSPSLRHCRATPWLAMPSSGKTISLTTIRRSNSGAGRGTNGNDQDCKPYSAGGHGGQQRVGRPSGKIGALGTAAHTGR
jgi:hypothetical protein